MRLRYAVVFERLPDNYGAYVPDLPGCISTGETWDEMQQMIREAISFHVEGCWKMASLCRSLVCPCRKQCPIMLACFLRTEGRVPNRTRPSRWSRWTFQLDRPVQSQPDRALSRGSEKPPVS